MGVCDDGEKARGMDDGAAGGAVGGDIREVQLAGCCKHAVGVCDDGEKARGAADGAAGAAGGRDIRGAQLAGCCKHAVGVCDDHVGRKPGEWLMGQLGRRVEAISGELNSQDVANTLWAIATMGMKGMIDCNNGDHTFHSDGGHADRENGGILVLLGCR